jgi:glycine/D-amino acid oxidase-like deaminating enzyme
VQPPKSLWWSSLVPVPSARASLHRDIDVDVAIVGGGYTGLWTARELLRHDATLRIAILEKAVCGFGASGRNGGWASSLFPLDDAHFLERHGLDALLRMRALLQRAVVDLGQAIHDDGIDADFVQGGWLCFARNQAQEQRLKLRVQRAPEFGDGDLLWLGEGELRDVGYVQGARGATYSPHCARLHPAKLVRALSEVVERLGATIYEDTLVTRIVPGSGNRRPRLVSVGGTVSADYVVRATEGFTPNLPGDRRSVVPIYSMMIASEPQSEGFWGDAGFSRYETFSDARQNIIYAQRTADDRIAFGGRGAPYHFGSSVEQRFDAHRRTFRALETTLRELFPTLSGAITHRWGGPLAMPRDHEPSVVIDHRAGLIKVGGYTGDGVVLSHVCARVIADALGAPDVDGEFASLAFVHHESPKWEYEPLRWIGAKTAQSLANRIDRADARNASAPSAERRLGRLLS